MENLKLYEISMVGNSMDDEQEIFELMGLCESYIVMYYNADNELTEIADNEQLLDVYEYETDYFYLETGNMESVQNKLEYLKLRKVK